MRDRAKQREHERRYAASAKGRARVATYNQSPKGLARMLAYAHTAKGQARNKRYQARNLRVCGMNLGPAATPEEAVILRAHIARRLRERRATKEDA